MYIVLELQINLHIGSEKFYMIIKVIIINYITERKTDIAFLVCGGI